MKSIGNNKTETLIVCVAIGLVAGGVLGMSAKRQQNRGADRSAIGQQEQPGQQQLEVKSITTTSMKRFAGCRRENLRIPADYISLHGGSAVDQGRGSGSALLNQLYKR